LQPHAFSYILGKTQFPWRCLVTMAAKKKAAKKAAKPAAKPAAKKGGKKKK
jgi:hypothetical protein